MEALQSAIVGLTCQCIASLSPTTLAPVVDKLFDAYSFGVLNVASRSTAMG